MNIKRLDPYKGLFVYFVDTLPLDAMEFDIQQSNDPLIKQLYKSLNEAEKTTNDKRYREINRKMGILGIYCLFDGIYSDFIRWMLSQIQGIDLKAKNPEHWRVNKK